MINPDIKKISLPSLWRFPCGVIVDIPSFLEFQFECFIKCAKFHCFSKRTSDQSDTITGPLVSGQLEDPAWRPLHFTYRPYQQRALVAQPLAKPSANLLWILILHRWTGWQPTSFVLLLALRCKERLKGHELNYCCGRGKQTVLVTQKCDDTRLFLPLCLPALPPAISQSLIGADLAKIYLDSWFRILNMSEKIWKCVSWCIRLYIAYSYSSVISEFF